MSNRARQHLFLLLASLAFVACDDTAGTGSPNATPEEPELELQPRASWILTDTGRFVRNGRKMTVTTKNIPHWDCDGSARILDTSRVVLTVDLDAKGRPESMTDPDTLKSGSIVLSMGSFTLLEGGAWGIRMTDSVIKKVAADSVRLRVRSWLVTTFAMELDSASGKARLYLAGWSYAPAWVAGLTGPPSHITASAPSENQGRLQNKNTGEVVTAVFQATLGDPRITWSSSRSVRTVTTTGGIPAACPAVSSPSWLTDFFSGK